MATLPISAVDAVAPALDRMKQILFRPFRFGLWWRLFVIGFLTGEFSSGSGWLRGVLQFPAMLGRSTRQRQLAPVGPWGRTPHLPNLAHLLPILLILVFVVAVVALIFMYLGTVMRFVLLEAVVNGRVRLRQSFGRWQAVAGSLFVWRLLFSLILLAVVLLLVSGPLVLAWRAGFLPEAFRAMWPLIALVTLFVLVVGIVAGVIWVLVKDFAVPLMALEGLSATEACLRLMGMIRDDPGAYAGYIGMKIVLALAAGIITGLAILVVMIVLLIPVLIFVMVGAFSRGSVATHALAITMAIVIGVVALIVLFVVGAAVGVATVVFFQAYVLQFFAGRYERLGAVLFPQPLPPTPPAPES
jgi:hypothetical protein